MPFINEDVPKEFMNSFDKNRFRGEGGFGSVTTNPMFRWSRWTIDRERDAALISVDNNGMTRRTVDDTLPDRTWYALLWQGRVISFETTTGAYDVPGGAIAPGTEREYQIDVWFDTDIWLDDDLIEQLPQVLQLAKEAYYHFLRFPDPDYERVFVQDVEIRYRSVNGVEAVGVFK
jgi:hypothetical protein